MDETREQVATVLGKPRMAAAFGSDMLSWQFQLGGVDAHEYSHQVVFRRSTGKLVSITRNYDPEIDVDVFFPASETTVHRTTSGPSPFVMRMRRLPGDVVLLSPGAGKSGQIVLMRQRELRFFYPQLAGKQ